MLIYIGMYGRKFFLFCDIEVYTFFKIIGQIGQIPLENIRLCVPSFEHGGGEGCNSADKKLCRGGWRHRPVAWFRLFRWIAGLPWDNDR